MSPSATFNIASGSDDAYGEAWGVTYPPTTSQAITPAATIIQVNRMFFSDTNYYVCNGFLRWDTSSLPDDAVITGATLRTYVSVIENANALGVCADYYTWATPVVGDISTTAGTNAITGYPLASLTLNADNDIPLAGFSGISKTGTTYMRLHITQRAADAPPTGNNRVWLASFEDATATEPRLIITYDLPPPIAPDAIISQTNLTGTLSDIQDDPDAPDANWLLAP